MKRRIFLHQVSVLTAGSLISGYTMGQALASSDIIAKKIIIRAGWSLELLGDRLYLPAVFRLIQRNIPGAEIYFWPYEYDPPVFEKIQANTTKMHVLTGQINTSFESDSNHIMAIIDTADLVIMAGGSINDQGSDSNPRDIKNSMDTINYCIDKGIPLGFHSLQLPLNFPLEPGIVNIINNSSFVFTSYPLNSKKLAEAGITNKNIGFAPDAGFYYDMNDDSIVNKYLASIGFEGQDYLFIPLAPLGPGPGNPEKNKSIALFNNILDSWITETSNPVLILAASPRDAETVNQISIESLSEEIMKRVVIIDAFNNPSELLSLIDKARICIGNDHYPTMLAVSSRVPLIYIKTDPLDQFPSVLESVGLQDSVVNIESLTPDDVIKLMFDIHKNYVNALVKSDDAMKIIIREEANSLKSVDKQLVERIKSKSRESKKSKSK